MYFQVFSSLCPLPQLSAKETGSEEPFIHSANWSWVSGKGRGGEGCRASPSPVEALLLGGEGKVQGGQPEVG